MKNIFNKLPVYVYEAVIEVVAEIKNGQDLYSSTAAISQKYNIPFTILLKIVSKVVK